MTSMQDRPSARELVEAVREFVEADVLPLEELPRRVAFHARVAVNALGIVERELELGRSLESQARARLVGVLDHEGTVEELTHELAVRIRDGSLDDRRDEVVATVRELVRGKLEVANPGHLASG
jgi:uncharacterized protein DUF6285